MFFVEIAASLLSGSVSLRADALDFLGDAANYALALAVFGMALHWRASAALLKGGVMGAFGLWVAASTAYHAIFATVPQPETMSVVGTVALAANAAVATLLYRYRQTDSQALSVWLCTRNDCIVNVAVIAAGAGVWASRTPWPDIAVAAAVAGLALSSALRVCRRALREMCGYAGFSLAEWRSAFAPSEEAAMAPGGNKTNRPTLADEAHAHTTALAAEHQRSEAFDMGLGVGWRTGRLTAFGLFAVTAMLVCHSLEQRSRWFTFAFAASCALGSVYGLL